MPTAITITPAAPAPAELTSAEKDAATTQTLVNALRTALIDLGAMTAS